MADASGSGESFSPSFREQIPFSPLRAAHTVLSEEEALALLSARTNYFKAVENSLLHPDTESFVTNREQLRGSYLEKLTGARKAYDAWQREDAHALEPTVVAFDQRMNEEDTEEYLRIHNRVEKERLSPAKQGMLTNLAQFSRRHAAAFSWLMYLGGGALTAGSILGVSQLARMEQEERDTEAVPPPGATSTAAPDNGTSPSDEFDALVRATSPAPSNQASEVTQPAEESERVFVPVGREKEVFAFTNTPAIDGDLIIGSGGETRASEAPAIPKDFHDVSVEGLKGPLVPPPTGKHVGEVEEVEVGGSIGTDDLSTPS